MLKIRPLFKADSKIKRSEIRTVVDSKPPAAGSLKHQGSRLVLYFLFLVSVFLIFTLYNLQKIYSKNITHLKEAIVVISRSKGTMQDALKKVVRKDRVIRTSLLEEQKKVEGLSAGIAQLLDYKTASENRLEAFDSALNKMKNENSRLRDEIKQVSQQRDAFGEKVGFLERAQDSLQRKVKRLLTRTKVELGALVVKPSTLHGKVLKANSKYNFVIVDLGKNDGIREGTTLLAYRQDQPIGEIMIEKVYDELSAGKALFDWTGDELSIGDTVRGKD